MRSLARIHIVTCLGILLNVPATARACTSILVSRGASQDGSVFITYSADAPFMPRLLYVPGGDHKPGTMVDVVGWEDSSVRGQIRQAAHTNAVVGLMNEHQLTIGETTTGGRGELVDPKGQLAATLTRPGDDLTGLIQVMTFDPIESGPASPAVIDGQLVDDEIRGNIRRKTPADDGLTGTIVAKPDGDGRMALADGTSAIVREAKLSLKKN